MRGMQGTVRKALPTRIWTGDVKKWNKLNIRRAYRATQDGTIWRKSATNGGLPPMHSLSDLEAGLRECVGSRKDNWLYNGGVPRFILLME